MNFKIKYMKMYIYGAGVYGSKLVNKIQDEGYQDIIIAVIDKYTEKECINDIQIIRLDEVKDKSASVTIALADIVEAQKAAIEPFSLRNQKHTFSG